MIQPFRFGIVQLYFFLSLFSTIFSFIANKVNKMSIHAILWYDLRKIEEINES